MGHDGAHYFTPEEEAGLTTIVNSSLESTGTPGAIVGIWIPERGTWVQTFGVSNLETGLPPDIAETFRVGSITKTFVATVMLQLVDEGVISLDTPISEFDFDLPSSERATLANLLGMTSGIFSYTEDEAWAADYVANPMMAFKPEDAIAIARAHEPDFAPGEGIGYSNTNAILAGRMAEQLTGSTLEQLIADRLLTPELLAATSFPTEPAMPDPFMTGYAPATETQPMQNATESNPATAWAAGAMISSLNDLSIWVELLARGTMISPAMQTARLQTIPLPEGRNVRYGLGIMESFGFYGHSGGIAGYSSIMLHKPDDGATIVVATNLSDEHGGCADSITAQAIRLLYPDLVPPSA